MKFIKSWQFIAALTIFGFALIIMEAIVTRPSNYSETSILGKAAVFVVVGVLGYAIIKFIIELISKK